MNSGPCSQGRNQTAEMNSSPCSQGRNQTAGMNSGPFSHGRNQTSAVLRELYSLPQVSGHINTNFMQADILENETTDLRTSEGVSHLMTHTSK